MPLAPGRSITRHIAGSSVMFEILKRAERDEGEKAHDEERRREYKDGAGKSERWVDGKVGLGKKLGWGRRG